MLLQTKELCFQYSPNHWVLREVNLTLQHRISYALLGPSGCGKSTLLQLFAGLQVPTKGTLQTSFSTAYPISIVFQDYGLFPWKRVRDNIFLPQRLHHPMHRQETQTLIHYLGLEPLLDQWPRTLSGGQKQRVALARALSTQPELFLLDEPFAALDAFTRENLQDLLKEMWKNQGFSFVLVTHDLMEAAYLAETILILSPHTHTITTQIANPGAHTSHYRESEAYFQLCQTLRRHLQEAQKSCRPEFT
jgi:ABC-type nitrate/sulfonate/bicarbonate transport system ATPase subunit